ncbi:hypothetical protein V6Z11_1Z123900 [Gossypium hirsutum]
MKKKGIVVWLDVPLEALAQRIAAVGTHSRPLLHYEHGDPYTKALKRLSYLLELRGKIMLSKCPGFIGRNCRQTSYRDVSDLTPTEIAIESFLSLCPIFSLIRLQCLAKWYHCIVRHCNKLKGI